MANSVGSVSIDLEARIAKFTSDLGRAARIAEQRSNEMRRTLGMVAGALGATVSIVGITAWIKSAVDAQDAISKMSQKVAVSTETLSGWQLAAQQAGVGTDAMQKGLVKLGQSAALAAEGGKLQSNAFKSIGVSATDAGGHLKNIETLFGQVADKLAGYKDSTEKTVIATRLFGKAGADLIPLLNAGSAGLAEYKKMADDFGLTVGSKSAKAAEAFNDSVEQLGFVSKGVANQIATSLAPAMADLADKAVSFFRSDSWKSALESISAGAKSVADHIGDIINAVKLLGEIVATVYATKMILWGTRWIGNLTAQSAAIAANGAAVTGWGAATAASFGNAYKNIGALGIAFNVLGSAVVGWEIGKYLSAQFLEVRLAGIALVDGLLTAWEDIKFAADVTWEAIAFRAKQAIDGILNYFSAQASDMAQRAAKLPDWLGGAKLAQAYQSVAAAIKPATDATADYDKKMDALTGTHNAALKAIHDNTDGMADYEIAQNSAKSATAKSIPIIKEQGAALAIVNDNAADAAKALAAAYEALYDGLQRITDAANPAQKAYSDFANTVKGMAKLGADAISKGADVATVQGVVAQAVAAAGQTMARELAKPMIAAQEYGDALDEQLTARKRLIAAQVASIGMGTQEAANYQQLIGVTQEAADAIGKLQRQHELHPEAFGPGQYEAEIEKTRQFYEDLKAATVSGQEAISAAQADWHNGVSKAMADFMEEQSNVAKQSEDFAKKFMDGFGDAFADFVSGTKSAKEAFGSLIDSMYRDALKFLANQAMAQLMGSFGGQGATGSGGAGGANLFGSLFSAFAGMFGPSTIGAGLAVGGMAYAGSVHPVNENGPEIFTYNNRDYLAAGNGNVKVTPITQARSYGGNTTVNVNVQPTSTRRTADQVAQEVARKQRIASARAA